MKTKFPFDPIEIYFQDSSIQVDLTIKDMIDWYSYHDAPASVFFGLTLEEAKDIVSRLQSCIDEWESDNEN